MHRRHPAHGFESPTGFATQWASTCASPWTALPCGSCLVVGRPLSKAIDLHFEGCSNPYFQLRSRFRPALSHAFRPETPPKDDATKACAVKVLDARSGAVDPAGGRRHHDVVCHTRTLAPSRSPMPQRPRPARALAPCRGCLRSPEGDAATGAKETMGGRAANAAASVGPATGDGRR